jgi:hypothetical protein
MSLLIKIIYILYNQKASNFDKSVFFSIALMLSDNFLARW